MVNKYAGVCFYCSATVPANGGDCWRQGRRFVVAHLACKQAGGGRVVYTRFSSGAEVYQNRAGRCEDAPCCGCCS